MTTATKAARRPKITQESLTNHYATVDGSGQHGHPVGNASRGPQVAGYLDTLGQTSMQASVRSTAPSSPFRTLAVVAIVHALLVALSWAGEFYFDLTILPGRVWLVLAWLWLTWPLVLLLHPDRSPMRVFVPCLISFALLAPCLSTVWTFTVWAIGGFAP